jgi:glycosyltransferase involved in cell wall biosynthesis
MHALIDARPDIVAWYCPTSFWPSVTQLARPQLICVPDVMLTDFAGGFGEIGGDRLLDTFRQIERTLSTGRHFVTYSDHVRQHTLVRRFGVAPSDVSVVRHGAVRLDPLIAVRGSPDPGAATDAFCRSLLGAALRRASVAQAGRLGDGTRFLFYASQFRPNKNIPNLLRACDHLLRKRYVGCKLVLTGNPDGTPELMEQVTRLGLDEEVLFLHRLTPQELAACYRLATLAVNPSLFEGGFPFTFSEALSVGTPVVMARIPVTQEEIVDSDLDRDMLFDPYDWRDLAARIEWALANRQSLLARQQAYFQRHVAVRTWTDALDDYVVALDRVASEPTRAQAA